MIKYTLYKGSLSIGYKCASLIHFPDVVEYIL